MAMFPTRRPRQKSSLLAEFDEEIALQTAARENAERADPLKAWSAAEAVTSAPDASPLVTPRAPERPVANATAPPPAAILEPRPTPPDAPPALAVAPAPVASAGAPPQEARAAPPAAEVSAEPTPAITAAPPVPDAVPLTAASALATPPEPPTFGDVEVRIGRQRRPRTGAGVYAAAAALAVVAGGGAWFAGHRPAPSLPTAPRLAPPPAVAPKAPALLPRPTAQPAPIASPAPEIAAAPAPAMLPAPEVVSTAPHAPRARRSRAQDATVAPPVHSHHAAPTRAPVAVASRESAPPPLARAEIPAPPRIAETRAPATPAPSTGAVQLATTTTDPAPRSNDDFPGKRKRATRRAAIDAIRALQMR